MLIVINIALLFLVFGAAKKKLNPYLLAAILGAIKAGLYLLATRSIIVTAGVFVVFGGLAATMVYFLARIDRKESTEERYSMYGARKAGPFIWEYIPISLAAVVLVFGEFIASFLFSPGAN